MTSGSARRTRTTSASPSRSPTTSSTSRRRPRCSARPRARTRTRTRRPTPSSWASTARAPRPRKLTFQTPRSAMTAGTFRSSGAVKKWSSMAWAPSRKRRGLSLPRASASGSRPGDADALKRPPTQFQNSKSRVDASTPQRSTLSLAVRDAQATKCALTTPASPSPAPCPSMIHALTLAAFRSVSAVPQLLETTIPKVLVGSRPRTASSNATGSTFARNRTSRGRSSLFAGSAPAVARNTNSGPR
mmetsp:Transcript_23210/g.76230  ORF Transcript_23210/g.76230 Transcript_23210/m.76230 type:complete len:245 (-) Transcript_23210:914-1648(-)